jgi:hypothetical protein
MRSGGGPTGIMVYCADYRCSHSIEMSAEQWDDDVRCRILSRGLSAKPVANVALTSGHISRRLRWGPPTEAAAY